MLRPIVFKIIVLGHQAVGKSSMLIRFIKGSFSPQYVVTLGAQFSSKSVEIDAKTTVKLQIWDTAGQQTYRSVIRSFYNGIAGVFLIYAIDNQQSFIALKDWLNQARQSTHEEVVFFLVGCKADLQSNRKVSHQRANQLLKQIGGVFFIQTSAKTGMNIEELFQRSATIMYKKFMTNTSFKKLVQPNFAEFPEKHDSISLNNTLTIKKQKKCC